MTRSPRYLRAFELESAPFGKELSDGSLWLPPSKETIVATLVEALSERASVLVTVPTRVDPEKSSRIGVEI